MIKWLKRLFWGEGISSLDNTRKSLPSWPAPPEPKREVIKVKPALAVSKSAHRKATRYKKNRIRGRYYKCKSGTKFFGRSKTPYCCGGYYSNYYVGYFDIDLLENCAQLAMIDPGYNDNGSSYDAIVPGGGEYGGAGASGSWSSHSDVRMERIENVEPAKIEDHYGSSDSSCESSSCDSGGCDCGGGD